MKRRLALGLAMATAAVLGTPAGGSLPGQCVEQDAPCVAVAAGPATWTWILGGVSYNDAGVLGFHNCENACDTIIFNGGLGMMTCDGASGTGTAQFHGEPLNAFDAGDCGGGPVPTTNGPLCNLGAWFDGTRFGGESGFSLGYCVQT